MRAVADLCVQCFVEIFGPFRRCHYEAFEEEEVRLVLDGVYFNTLRSYLRRAEDFLGDGQDLPKALFGEDVSVNCTQDRLHRRVGRIGPFWVSPVPIADQLVGFPEVAHEDGYRNYIVEHLWVCWGSGIGSADDFECFGELA